MITPTTRMILTQRLGRMMAKRQRKGFTLIELLVVVVIIGILASVALPSFVGAQDKARNSAVQGNLNTVRMALEQYATDNNGSYPTTDLIMDSSSDEGLRKHNYLPGNSLPRSPWAKDNQTAHIPPAPLIVASSVADSGVSQVGDAVASSGAVPSGAPDEVKEYGAISYDLEPGSMTYVIYGTGKKGKEAIVASGLSNAGQ